jgi:histidine ammonia-lyase
MHLAAQDLQTAANWMEIRKAQDASRSFGKAPTAALKALRAAVPSGRGGDRPARHIGMITYDFMRETPATTFYPGGPQQPPGMTIPKAGSD